MEASLQTPQPDQQQVSFHFWNCQLTEASPKYSWDPEKWGATTDCDNTDERRKRRPGRQGDGEGDANSKEQGPVAENGHKNGSSNGEKHDAEDNGEDNGEAVIDADYMQHVLKVNACILGPKATGVHLISVRTKCYQSEPDNCPIVCIDPDSQRTLCLAYEFVLDSQNEVTFELTEGTGPVWLTGLHQVRVHEDTEDGEGEGEGETEAEANGEDVDEAMASDESVKEPEEEEEEDDDDDEDAEEEEDEEDEDEEEIRPPPKRVARASKSERPVPSPKQPRRRAPAKQPAAKTGAKAKSPSPSPKTKATKEPLGAAAKGRRGAAAKSKA